MNLLSLRDVAKVSFFDPAKGWLAYLIICLIYLLLLVIGNNLVFTDRLYYQSFAEQFSINTIENIINLRDHYLWLGYLLIPLMVIFKVSFATICISIGAVLSTIEFKFKTIFKAVLLAECVFILAQVLYLVNLSFHLESLTLETASNYHPFTALSYLGTENVVPWLQYPLQTLNVFEFFYMVVIAWLLSRQWEEDFIESLALVVPSYGTGLILWLVLVTFLTLQVS